jgi:hypothetical protein
MSDSCYNVLALIPVESDFGIEKAVDAFVTEGQSATPVTPPTGSGVGFRVVHVDDWAIVAWLEESTDVLDENQEIVEAFGNPPGVAGEPPTAYDRRLSVWSDDDSDMVNAHFFEEYIEFLKEKLGLFIFDSQQGIWR